jgi:hypothetical protein
MCSNEIFSARRWSVSRSTHIGDIQDRIPTRWADFFSLPDLENTAKGGRRREYDAMKGSRGGVDPVSDRVGPPTGKLLELSLSLAGHPDQ